MTYHVDLSRRALPDRPLVRAWPSQFPVQGGENQTPPADEQPTGQHPHRGQSWRVRKIDFAQLNRLSTSADQELREAEDALVAFMEQQAKRDALYAESREELERKYEFGRTGGVA